MTKKSIVSIEAYSLASKKIDKNYTLFVENNKGLVGGSEVTQRHDSQLSFLLLSLIFFILFFTFHIKLRESLKGKS